MQLVTASVLSFPSLGAVYTLDIGDGTFVPTPDTREGVSRNPTGSKEMGEVKR